MHVRRRGPHSRTFHGRLLEPAPCQRSPPVTEAASVPVAATCVCHVPEASPRQAKAERQYCKTKYGHARSCQVNTMIALLGVWRWSLECSAWQVLRSRRQCVSVKSACLLASVPDAIHSMSNACQVLSISIHQRSKCCTTAGANAWYNQHLSGPRTRTAPLLQQLNQVRVRRSISEEYYRWHMRRPLPTDR